MARDTGPQCKQCRREGQKLFLKGERCLTDKCGVERRSYPPGDHGRGRQKQSEYRVQLREKQKAKRYYGVLETQFRNYYSKASRQTGVTGEKVNMAIQHQFSAANKAEFKKLLFFYGGNLDMAVLSDRAAGIQDSEFQRLRAELASARRRLAEYVEPK